MRLPAVTCCLLLLASPMARADRPPTPVLVDTEIGTDLDDACALALLLASDQCKLLGVTTCGGQAEDRAWMVCRLLSSVGRDNLPIAFGRAPQPDSQIDWQIQYRRHPAVVWNRTVEPDKAPAETVMQRVLQHHTAHDQSPAAAVTILCTGPLTNVARLLKKHPESKQHIARIVLSAGAVDATRPAADTVTAGANLGRDLDAARTVQAAGVPVVYVTSPGERNATLDAAQAKQLFAAHNRLTWELQSLVQLASAPRPLRLSDAVAARVAFDPNFTTTQPVKLTAGDLVFPVQATPKIDIQEFAPWYVGRLTAYGKPVLPNPPGNRTQPVDRGGLPRRVHAFEDYDTDIERRWWMTGRLATEDLPAGSRRAFRAVLTQDFDAKQGDLRPRYKAVVFNPVPGPPMGPRPRLAFRYKLRGTDTLRVQLFSLSNGYHRYLSLSGLEQNHWAEATVDMTHMRRPDGTGGALAEDERIDDIQFYVDPRADLWIDQMILYDAAAPATREPFPRRILFTGWFDTGRQGREWPGTFEIVPHEKPRTWDAARSVRNRATGKPWIHLNLRGRRRLDQQVRLRFWYKLLGPSKPSQLQVALADTSSEQQWKQTLSTVPGSKWTEATLSFAPKPGGTDHPHADALYFHAPAESTLLIDDVLLYVP